MADETNDEDIELLGELGVEAEPIASGGRTAKEQRIIAGVEEIERFVEAYGRLPQHGENQDIFERIYAVRLDRIRECSECRGIVESLDKHGMLGSASEQRTQTVKETSDDKDLLAALGVATDSADDVTNLIHVRTRDEIRAAEEIAKRDPCKDFASFKSLFETVQKELESGMRQTRPYKDNAEANQGDMFILDGQKVLVAEMGEPFVSDYGRPDRRLRVVYDNGTECNLLLRSLQRALNKDKASRRITQPNLGPLFSESEESDDLPTGYIYVLRSKSNDPFVAANRSVIHKIGVTGGDVKSRIANAKKDPTYLLADVEIVATFKLANLNRKKLESLIHRFFSSARLDVELGDRFGTSVQAWEWFLVPLPAIEEAIQMLIAGSIDNFYYEPKEARILRR